MTQLRKGKEMDLAANAERQGPLRLLDLPVDILREIIKEVTYTNDLTSLALTHPALHDLAIPYIYSRFDIVWPEAHASNDSRTGVDALTYGLSTLVMTEDIFPVSTSSTPSNAPCYVCTHCGGSNQIREGSSRQIGAVTRKRRKGNRFAQYIRKFSLGNGPSELVQEYLIWKESGKMLGTLVALAVARMTNLETFVWDMPTGILRDVWSALASLGEGLPREDPRFEKIWIRWHDNKSSLSPVGIQNAGGALQLAPPGTAAISSITTSVAPATQAQSIPVLTARTSDDLLSTSYRHIEHPNLSILPPLKSITVLNIDEPAYLDELSVLVHRSLGRLRELRIGLASVRHTKNWYTGQKDIPTSSGVIAAGVGQYLASGGALGLVMNKLYDCRRRASAPTNMDGKLGASKHANAELITGNLSSMIPSLLQHVDSGGSAEHYPDNPTYSQEHQTVSAFDSQPLPATPITAEAEQGHSKNIALSTSRADQTIGTSPSARTISTYPIPTAARVVAKKHPKLERLHLEVLELEKIPLDVQVLQKTIDWTILTSLTLLNCESDEELWKALRRTYTPREEKRSPSMSAATPKRSSLAPLAKSSPTISAEYRLRLKKIHTNNVSPALIAFLKEALAPNSLEWMFLQDGGVAASTVTVESIFRGPLRRHRSSLKKVLIDSGCRRSTDSARNSKSKRWMFNRNILNYVTNGKMPLLRELGMVIDYKDWHFFLQRLPQIPHLRSLYVPHVADRLHEHDVEFSTELALQIVDIVTLRPEIELCYIGITTKCFEIHENKCADDILSGVLIGSQLGATSAATGDTDDESAMENDDDDDDEDDEEDENNDVEDNQSSAEAEVDSTGTSEANSDDEDVEMDGRRSGPRLRLREILFYDDKVSIFRARHGQL